MPGIYQATAMCIPINRFGLNPSSINTCDGISDLINTPQRGGTRRIVFWNYCIRTKLRTASCLFLRTASGNRLTEVAGIAFTIFFCFILCKEGNEDMCMRIVVERNTSLRFE